MRPRVAVLITALAVTASLTFTGPATGATPPIDPGNAPVTSAQYVVIGPKTLADRNAVAKTGAAIDLVEHGNLYITATPAEVSQIRGLGFLLEALPAPE